MNSIIKWLVRTAAVLFGVGALLAIGGWALGGQTQMEVNVAGQDMTVGLGGIRFSASPREGGGRERVNVDDLVPFEEIDVDVALGEVYLRPGDSYGLTLSWNEERYALHYTNEGGKLRVWSSAFPGAGVPFGGNLHASVTIYYPKGTEFDQLTVKTALGTVDLSDFSARRLDLEANLGSVRLADAALGSGDLKLSLGDLELERVKADELDLKLSLGALKAREIDTARELTIENHMGETVVAGSLAGKTKIVSNMGDVSVAASLPRRDYGYDLSTSMGSVRIDGEHMDDEAVQRGGAHQITVENSMGDIALDFS